MKKYMRSKYFLKYQKQRTITSFIPGDFTALRRQQTNHRRWNINSKPNWFKTNNHCNNEVWNDANLFVQRRTQTPVIVIMLRSKGGWTVVFSFLGNGHRCCCCVGWRWWSWNERSGWWKDEWKQFTSNNNKSTEEKNSEIFSLKFISTCQC